MWCYNSFGDCNIAVHIQDSNEIAERCSEPCHVMNNFAGWKKNNCPLGLFDDERLLLEKEIKEETQAKGNGVDEAQC